MRRKSRQPETARLTITSEDGEKGENGTINHYSVILSVLSFKLSLLAPHLYLSLSKAPDTLCPCRLK